MLVQTQCQVKKVVRADFLKCASHKGSKTRCKRCVEVSVSRVRWSTSTIFLQNQTDDVRKMSQNVERHRPDPLFSQKHESAAFSLHSSVFCLHHHFRLTPSSYSHGEQNCENSRRYIVENAVGILKKRHIVLSQSGNLLSTETTPQSHLVSKDTRPYRVHRIGLPIPKADPV